MKLACGKCRGSVFDVNGTNDGLVGSCPIHGRVHVRIEEATAQEVKGLIQECGQEGGEVLSRDSAAPVNEPRPLGRMSKVSIGAHKCPGCGSEVKFDDMEVAEGLAASIKRMARAVHCDTCKKKLEQREREMKAGERMKIMIDSNMVRADLTRYSLNCSDPSVEAKNPELWKWIKAYEAPGLRDDGRPSNLYLWGKPGTGKTFAIRCVLNILANAGNQVMEKSANEVLDQMGSKRTRPDFLQLCGNTWAAYFSDCHIPNWNAEAMTDFWHVIDVRHTRGFPTFLDANMDLLALDRVFTKARPGNAATAASLWERLRPADVFEVDGESLRRKD